MRLQDLFRGWSKAHGNFTPGAVSPKGKVSRKSAATVKDEPTDHDWTRHLAGEAPGLGIIPLLDDDESVWFGAVDIDKYDVDIAELERKCEALPIVLSRSKSGGAHLWLFCQEPTPATLVVAKLTEIAAWLGYGGCEIFPKQTSRANDNDTGNWINMPYYGSTRKGILQGKDIELDRFVVLGDMRRATIAQIMSISLTPDEEWFADGPPCLQQLHKGGFQEGTRNNGLFNVGVYFRNKHSEGWERELLNYNNEEMAEPLPVREVQSLADNIRRKDYGFTCNQPPIQPHCNKPLCQKRAFGIGGTSGGGQLDVSVGRLTKYDSRPPMWVLDVNGQRVQVETDDLLQQSRFQKLCVEHCNHFPAPVKPAVWNKAVQGWLQDVEVLPAPQDASPEGQFLALVTGFIRDRQRDDVAEMTLGNVWVTKQWAHFRSTDLLAYIRREAFTAFSAQKMYTILHQKMDCTEGEVNIKGAQVQYWRVRTVTLQTEAHDIPSYNSPFEGQPKH